MRLVTVTGEPGVGKSRLVREFRAFVDAEPELVAWRQGHCLPYGEGISFWALGEVLKAQAGILEFDGPATVAAKLADAVAAVVGLDPLSDADTSRLIAAVLGRAVDQDDAFWHTLTREVAYGQLPRTARIAKHRAVAAWIERVAGDRIDDHAELLAHHYLTALELARAARAAEETAALHGPPAASWSWPATGP